VTRLSKLLQAFSFHPKCAAGEAAILVTRLSQIALCRWPQIAPIFFSRHIFEDSFLFENYEVYFCRKINIFHVRFCM
jgi:hypothetical protein